MCHDYDTTDDQIATGRGPRGPAPGAGVPARLLVPVLAQGLTQHQLFALLALKTFFKTDYRGTVQLLKDFAELRDDLGLTDVPHYSTLCYAAGRLLKKGSSSASSCRPPSAPKRAA